MIEYEFTKNDFKRYLKYKRYTTNIIFIIIGSLLYFYITYYLLFTNPFETFIYYLLYFIVLIGLILLFNELYCIINIRKNKNIIGKYKVDIKKNKIIVIINDNSFEYLNSNIKKIKRCKRYFKIEYYNHFSLFFMRSLINNNDYEKIINITF